MLTIPADLTAEELQKLARRERDARVGRRMLAIANALDDMSRRGRAGGHGPADATRLGDPV